MNDFANRKKCSVDIETNDLLENMIDFSKGFPLTLKNKAKLWCISITDFTDLNCIKTISIIHRSVKQTRAWLKTNLLKFDEIYLQNGHKFDLPALLLFKVLDYTIGYPGESDTVFGVKTSFKDTLIYSRILNPSRYKGHSLKAWGKRVGYEKMEYRKWCIENNIIASNSPSGAEFKVFNLKMVEYCEDDTIVTYKAVEKLEAELEALGKPSDWEQALKFEHKGADLAIQRELFGFDFDEKAAYNALEDLDTKIENIRAMINPHLPQKPFNKSELAKYTLPKTQLNQDNSISKHLENFANKFSTPLFTDLESQEVFITYNNTNYKLPYNEPLETHRAGDIADLAHVKKHLISLGWVPTEWGVRDLTKNSSKENIPIEKRKKALKRYFEETYSGHYKMSRYKELGIDTRKLSESAQTRLFKQIYADYYKKIQSDFPVRVITSPRITVGVAKDLCPNLVKMSAKIPFAKDFALYLTYKHRRSTIANKDFEWEEGVDGDSVPNTGFLSKLRIDGRVSTPAIEIGAVSNRYRHISVANIPRTSSTYGKEMRSLFGCGSDYYQLGFDYSSLENRVQGGYVIDYPQGAELAERLVAEKPNDLHSVTAKKIGLSRSDTKSFIYAITYGAYINKLSKMLGESIEQTEKRYEEFWNSVPALKALKEDLVKEWLDNDKKYITAIDNRKILTRSEHSLLNFLFQSGGVISAKYTNIFLYQDLEKQGFKINPFYHKPEVCNMIEYHDEQQIAIAKSLNIIRIKNFKTEKEAFEFHKSWKSTYQLSTVKYNEKQDNYYIVFPNKITKAIYDATKKTEKILKLKFNLGFEFDVHKNWYGCH